MIFDNVYKILHITPHLGGGVGSTILGYLSENKSFKHEVVAFGYTMEWARKRIESLNIPYQDHMDTKHKEIIDMIPDFDIVLIHSWNQPLLLDFLVRNELPSCRLIIWGHVSGFHPPDVYTIKILRYSDLFIFTSPLSYNLKDVQKLSEEEQKELLDIWSTGGTEEFRDIKKRKHTGFIIGYLGTVDYAKMHPDYLEICKEIIDLNIPHLKFIVIGKTKEKELRAEAEEMGISEKFEILGWVDSLKEYLDIFDVLGYPLNPDHFGTCDLALQEALAAGVVPIVLNNPMERSMVKHNKTGLVAKDKRGYIQAIKDMYNNINWRKELSDNARNDYDKRFSLKRLDSEWKEAFDKVMKFPKTSRKWDIDKEEITAKDVFLESLGEYSDIFVKNDVEKIKELGKKKRWQTTSKGTVHNYHIYFPDDPQLTEWSKLMEVKNEKVGYNPILNK